MACWFALAGRIGVPTERDGGPLVFTAPSPQTRLTVTESATVLSPEADDGDLQPALNGAVFAPGRPARQVVIARAEFEVIIGAPPDSLAFFETSNPSFGSGTRATPAGVATLRVSAKDRVGERAILGAAAGGDSGRARLRHRLGGANQAQPAEPAGFAVTPLLAGSATITGRTDPGVRVTVGGLGVPVAPDGSFRTTVGAGIFPSDVDVVATDLVGNTARARLSVVALVDYRELPWIPIVAVLTGLAALFLFLRAPRPRAVARASDASSFEEIE